MAEYLDSVTARMQGATDCKGLAEAAQSAIDSIKQAIQDCKDQSQELAEMMVPPTDLATTIHWIKLQIQTYVVPYATYLRQLEEYTAALGKIQQILADKARELACADEVQQ